MDIYFPASYGHSCDDDTMASHYRGGCLIWNIHRHEPEDIHRGAGLDGDGGKCFLAAICFGSFHRNILLWMKELCSIGMPEL